MEINRCVVCGAYIPEGRHVCKECAIEEDTRKYDDDDLVMFEKIMSKHNRSVFETHNNRDGKHKSKLKK